MAAGLNSEADASPGNRKDTDVKQPSVSNTEKWSLEGKMRDQAARPKGEILGKGVEQGQEAKDDGPWTKGRGRADEAEGTRGRGLGAKD